jgi:hypothetical protein
MCSAGWGGAVSFLLSLFDICRPRQRSLYHVTARRRSVVIALTAEWNGRALKIKAARQLLIAM